VEAEVDMKEFMVPWRDAMYSTMADIEIAEYLEKKKLQPFLKESHCLEDLMSWVHKVPDIFKELVQYTVRAFYSLEEIVLIDVLIQNPGMCFTFNLFTFVQIHLNLFSFCYQVLTKEISAIF